MASRSAVEAKRRRLADDLARTEAGYVPTPPYLAELLCGWPWHTLGDPGRPQVLEPSAGQGVLVEAILDKDPDAQVVAVEPDPGRAAAIGRHDGQVQVHTTTFEAYTQTAAGPLFDAVVANPPWSAPEHPRLWVEHILLAWQLLAPGGRLAAIIPPDVTPAGRDGNQLWDLVTAYGGLDPYEACPDEVRAGWPRKVRILWLVKPMPTVDGQPPWLMCPTPGAPVRVERLDVTARAALQTPVQEYPAWDWGGRRRTVRYAGVCASCARLLWAHDDGDEGAVSWQACSVLDPAEHGLAGPDVGLCMECRSHSDRYEAALKLARRHWTPAAAQPEPAQAAATPRWRTSGTSAPADDEAKRVVRHFQHYTSQQRADRASSHRLGPRQREAVGEFFYTHPDIPDRAFPTRGAAARAGAKPAHTQPVEPEVGPGGQLALL